MTNVLTKKMINIIVAVSFVFSGFAGYMPQTQAAVFDLPDPGQMIKSSSQLAMPVLKGLRFDPQNPLNIEFIIDIGDQRGVEEADAKRLIHYFLAGLTIPEDNMWVNLSPYEQDRIVSDSLAETDLGKDLLGQDYILKQLASSLTYPESPTGRQYWQRIYRKIAATSGNKKIDLDAFNKVWITPNKSLLYEKNNTALILEADLKVMLEEDYLALANNTSANVAKSNNKAVSDVTRSVIVPAIEQEVNHGQNFARLRQIYSALILSYWFKEKFKDSFYKAYIDQEKIKGIDINDKQAKEKIYNLYVKAFKKGVYNYVKRERDVASNKNVKRRYYSGGSSLTRKDVKLEITDDEALKNKETSETQASLLNIELGNVKSSISDAVKRDIAEIFLELTPEGLEKLKSLSIGTYITSDTGGSFVHKNIAVKQEDWQELQPLIEDLGVSASLFEINANSLTTDYKVEKKENQYHLVRHKGVSLVPENEKDIQLTIDPTTSHRSQAPDGSPASMFREIYFNNGISLNKLIEKTGLSEATVKRDVNRLISSGLVHVMEENDQIYFYRNTGLEIDQFSKMYQVLADVKNPTRPKTEDVNRAVMELLKEFNLAKGIKQTNRAPSYGGVSLERIKSDVISGSSGPAIAYGADKVNALKFDLTGLEIKKISIGPVETIAQILK